MYCYNMPRNDSYFRCFLPPVVKALDVKSVAVRSDFDSMEPVVLSTLDCRDQPVYEAFCRVLDQNAYSATEVYN